MNQKSAEANFPEDEQLKFSKLPEIKKILDEMDAEEPYRHAGLRCPKCGSMMAHYRLYGYRCMRGC